MKTNFLAKYENALVLPENPDYDLACDIIDYLDFDFWQPLAERLANQHDLTFTHCERVSEGANPVFIFEGDEKFILKLVPPNWSQQAVAEIAALSLFDGVDIELDVPKLMLYGKYRNWDYIFMSFVEGEILSNILTDITKKEKIDIAFQLGQFSKVLHGLDVPNLPEITLNWSEFLDTQLKNVFNKRQKQGLIEPFLSDLIPYLDSINIEHKINKNCFIHTDLHPGNLLVERTQNGVKLSGIIDFGDAVVCPDPVFEFTSPGLLLALSDKDVFESYLKGYEYCLDKPQNLVEQCMALSLLRHTGELNYILNTVPNAAQAKNWAEAEALLFPVSL
ncbi:phosphotransferase family protein [Pseudoalteromonas denitrificans]|uniref:Hygromycin-B 7''-O-kinase n=1 Tax=Pseudoalteromonas denitrificans DSM 6059 TaxID=1123010 RepID=A0A1I1TUQ6_9GAMM|nr:aminoglycoside phosphotransferase family protein [Pseudoalteromonas denitrificans]SFD60978.1 hygromycin-B 7''-O-kinase [Pseudoalteromonas denitrificans DSM 6059]